MNKNIIISSLILASLPSFSQIGIGTQTPEASSIVELKSSSKGFLPPRLTTAQAIAIANPTEGLIVYNINECCLTVFTDKWFNICEQEPVYISPTQQTKLTISSAAGNSIFGLSVSMTADGTRVVAGDYKNNPNGKTDGGAAYVFSTDGTNWTQEARLFPNDVTNNDNFTGVNVSISQDGTKIIGGSRLEDPSGIGNAGAAYVFSRVGTTWSQEVKLVANDAGNDDRFGRITSINSDGTVAIVSSHNDDDGGNDAGAVYVFTFNGISWSQEAKLLAGDASANDKFGFTLNASPDGSKFIVGSPSDDDEGSNAGAVYIFSKNGGTWSQEAKLTASDATAGDEFGYSVSMNLDGTRVVIGTVKDDDDGSASGSAYIFSTDGTTWTESAKLTANDGAAGDQFGYTVNLSSDGTKVIIASPFDDDNGDKSGSTYIFTACDETNWAQLSKIISNDGGGGDNFGRYVSLSADGSKAISSSIHNGASGAIYIIE